MRVFVSPERVYEELGAVRYRLSWELLKPEAEGKEEIDFDRDLDYRSGSFKTKKFMLGRLREACAGELEKLQGIVEVDEAFFGGKEANNRGYCAQLPARNKAKTAPETQDRPKEANQ